mmetsp:Transcript_1756/g.2322  ORF Transcript_1756/g.2322 Transcript_1756/m.2322 type:complete len:1071 (+) Transcript_1756:209-3421(+)
MSTNASTEASSPSLPRLGPTWRSGAQGRGFQPPPAVPAASDKPSTTNDDDKRQNRNSFSLLDDDEGTYKKKREEPQRSMGDSGRFISRSEGLRSTGTGSGGFSSRVRKSAGSGRSLSELASRLPSTTPTTSSSSGRPHVGTHSHRGGFEEPSTGNNSRMSGLRSEPTEEEKTVRFTRERLLSMRPRPDSDIKPPSSLHPLNGSPLLSEEPLDPVCWDNFDANEIWAVNRERSSRGIGKQVTTVRERKEGDREERRVTPNEGVNKWRRGVALPPSGEGSTRRSKGRYDDADNPEDLWDDPSTPQISAASDFSAFGGSLDDDPLQPGTETFDLTKLAEVANIFEKDRRGGGGGGEGSEKSVASSPDDSIHDHNVDPIRPLASAGTTIRSGSGDDVNVFEDFGEPDEESNAKPEIKSGNKSQTASSRLIKMLAVDGKSDDSKTEADDNKETTENLENSTSFLFGAGSLISKNPWGLPPPVASNTQPEPFGIDLASKLKESTLEQERAGQNELERLKMEEMERVRRMEEEKKRQDALLAQQQIGLQARQAALQEQHTQKPSQGPNQIELILTERISTILENSWGRSDLMSILSNLHSEDPRVIPLLSSVDALRALMARHPGRFAFAHDAQFGAEMAVLRMNNAAWQKQQQAEDFRRNQEEQQRILAARQEAARAQAEAEAEALAKKASSEPIVITDSPWYYADPQGNVQGPFGGEEMRQWLEAGYFKGDLPISQNPSSQFRTLSSLFPDVAVAFKATVSSEAELAKQAAEEKEAQLKAEREAQEKLEREREMEARSKAEAAKAEALRQQQEAQSNKNQSAQLKMLLGLGGNESSAVNGISKESEDDQSLPQSKPSNPKETSGPTKVQPTPAPIPAPAWGGAGTAKIPAQKLSMSEIQQQEARVATRVVKPKPGWAGVAASGAKAWSGDVNVITSASVSATSAAPSSGASMQSRTKQQITGSTTQKQSKKHNSTQKTMEEFGANDKMTPVLESWCKDQMRKLSGNDDLTLIAFCMTLSDPVEIKGYLTAYLGSTPQVNNFATEFINRKNGKKEQEQWETTGAGKKSRKKKSAGGK